MSKMKHKETRIKWKNADFYLLYTIAFAGIALFLYMRFYLNGKSLIWSHDGVPQHLNSLAYYGRYLRKILHTLFIEHKLSIPMWDLNIGYGSDILTTLHYYVIGDPLTLLSVFFKSSQTEFLYEFLIFLYSGIHITLQITETNNLSEAFLFIQHTVCSAESL